MLVVVKMVVVVVVIGKITWVVMVVDSGDNGGRRCNTERC